MFSDQNDYNVQYLNLNLNVIIRNNITISFMVHQILLRCGFGDLFHIYFLVIIAGMDHQGSFWEAETRARCDWERTVV